MTSQMAFEDRRDAGARLATRLLHYAAEQPIVLALPRGGVPVADEVAHALGVALDVWIVRKLGAPDNPELGIGAVSEGGHVYLNDELVRRTQLSPVELAEAIRLKQREVEERVRRFRSVAPLPPVRGRTVLLVDDGIAMGATARAAIQAIRVLGPSKLVLAVPVGAAETLDSLRDEVDDLVCLMPVQDFSAVGAYYEDFAPVPDAEVTRILERARVVFEVTTKGYAATANR
ncbi:MAG TPA: phosphoribosyltransferase family protein [Polyangiaceae bacterium]